MHTAGLFLYRFRWYLAGLCIAAAVLAVCGWRTPTLHAAEEQPDLIAPADKDACLNCHADVINLKHFGGSAHGALNCQDCHKGINQYPHPPAAVAKKPACTACHTRNAAWLANSVHAKAHAATGTVPDCQACHGKNPHEIVKPRGLPAAQQEASCRNCHADKAAALAGSIHGASGPHAAGRPGCLSCHGGNPHAIKTPPKQPSARQNQACQQCHAADTARMLNSAHGKAIAGNASKPLYCLSCHGQNPHAITAAKQLTSNEKNALCEKCHADKEKLLQASAHGNTDMQSSPRPTCVTCHGSDLHDVTLTKQMTPARTDAPCRSCHAAEAQKLTASIHGQQMSKTGKVPDNCLACHGGGNPHAVVPIAAETRAQKEAACIACHRDLSASLATSVHNRPDKVPGDHPTCLTCHGGSPHGIQPPKHLTPLQKVELCSRCHADKARMARYGRTDAVEAYKATFHGRAITRFHQTAEATCVDCHGLHGILSPSDPRAPTTPQHAAMICGKCHAGNKMDFAYSYASHLRLNVEKSIVTPLEQKILYVLVFLPYLWFFALVGLGMSHALCRLRKPVLALRVESAFTVLGWLALLIALISAATLMLMHALAEPVPFWSLRSSQLLLALTCLALLLRRVIFRCPTGIK